MKSVPLFFFFFFFIPLSFAVLDVRETKYAEMHEIQLAHFGEKEQIIVPSQDVSITGFATATFATQKKLKKEYSGQYWMQRRRATQDRTSPFFMSLNNNNPADVAWEGIKRDARDNLGDSSQQRSLKNEYSHYWLERSLATYQYLALHNPSLVEKKIAPLVYTNMQEYLPYLTEVLNKRALTVEYNEEYWDEKNRRPLITSI